MGQERMMRRKMLAIGLFVAFGIGMGAPRRLAATETTTVHVVVNDAVTGDPVYQAHLTLEFLQPGGFLKTPKAISYTGKSDKQGRCVFPVVNMGRVTLMVTAPDHETFGKRFVIKKEDQLIKVKLRKPRPVL